MINDYHAVRAARKLREMPDDMIHEIASELELKMLENGVKVEDIAMFYESLKRQEPKVFGVTVTDATTATEGVSK